MLIGYARVSTPEQDLTPQLDALREAGCERTFSDKASGAKANRVGLADALSHARAGDVLVVWKLDRLGRTMKGLVDLARNRFGNVQVDALLLTPGAIAPNLRGREVRAALALDGPFATPVVDYKLRAAAIGFGETTVERLYAEGRARVDSDRILVPVRLQDYANKPWYKRMLYGAAYVFYRTVLRAIASGRYDE